MNTRISIVIVAVVAVISAIATVTVLSADKNAIAQEIKNWEWGSYGIICPPLQYTCGKSLSAIQCFDVNEAAKKLNQAVGTTLFTKESQAGKPLVTVHAKRPSYLEDDGLCSGDSLVGNMGRIYRRPTWINPITDFDIVICFGKIHQAQRFQDAKSSDYKAIKNTARIGNVGHIAHELVHVFTGDRVDHAHPKYGSGLMMPRPKSTEIGPVTRGVMGRVLQHCKAKGGR